MKLECVAVARAFYALALEGLTWGMPSTTGRWLAEERKQERDYEFEEEPLREVGLGVLCLAHTAVAAYLDYQVCKLFF